MPNNGRGWRRRFRTAFHHFGLEVFFARPGLWPGVGLSPVSPMACRGLWKLAWGFLFSKALVGVANWQAEAPVAL